ncbi:MAG: dephospho-CoA kinase [Muribaculaceae bacterium]|nr:dephospho-CoA kinase [Muribaculaceae bacterium]
MENIEKDYVRIIGITGGIGAGKSVVSRILRLKGYEVYDCDWHARRIMENVEAVVSSLKERFGEECYLADGSLDRAFLAEKIFSDIEERMWVNELVHTAVREDITDWVKSIETKYLSESLSSGGGVPVFIESAILHSSGLDILCTEIWIVDAPEEVRKERAMNRGGISETDLEKRISTQKREFEGLSNEKIKVIDNSGAKALLTQIDSLLDEYR